MQHFLDLDFEDQHNLGDHRLSDDTYTGCISDQLRVDAPRCRYTIFGQVFDFPKTDPGERKDDFVARLIVAIQRRSPPALLASITTALSQSGLACLERACLCRIAVSGGAQLVDCSLEACPNQVDSVVVRLQVLRRGFRSYSVDAEGCDVEPVDCDPGSSVVKTAVVSFSVEAGVDVVELQEVVNVLQAGRLVPRAELCKAILNSEESPSTSSTVANGVRSKTLKTELNCSRQAQEDRLSCCVL
jgi:hypothetical protein